MSNQEIYYLIKNETQYLKFINPKNPYISKSILQKYNFIFNNTPLKNEDQILYNYIHKINIPICKNCNKEIDFKIYSQGYKFDGIFCTNTCKAIFKYKHIFFKKHGNKYEYYWETYKNNREIMKIKCPIHGIFYQQPRCHAIGECKKCGNDRVSFKNAIPKVEILKQFILTHNNRYSYDLSNYKNTNSKIKINCPIHGQFIQCASNHRNGQGCPKCASKLVGKKLTLSKQQLLLDFNKIHKNDYTYYWETYINTSSKMKIKCNNCNNIFWQSPNTHKNHGCPSCCTCMTSNGEKRIIKYLENNNIKYIRQKQFKNCKYKKVLQFDFYLLDYNICIEYDGIQHFEYIKWFHKSIENFEIYKLKDKIKNNYCFVNKIKLIRITYTKENNIEEILNQLLYSSSISSKSVNE